MIVQLMGWNPNYRYRLLGKFIRSGDDHLYVFDLNETERFQRLMRDPKTGEVLQRASRTPIYSEQWKNQFGVPLEEAARSLQINIFNGYAVYGLTEEKKTAVDTTPHVSPDNEERDTTDET